MTDLHSVGDLAAISYDAGVQLGAGRLQDRTVLLSAYDRKRLLGATGRLEKRYRQENVNLIGDLPQLAGAGRTMSPFAKDRNRAQRSAWTPDPRKDHYVNRKGNGR